MRALWMLPAAAGLLACHPRKAECRQPLSCEPLHWLCVEPTTVTGRTTPLSVDVTTGPPAPDAVPEYRTVRATARDGDDVIVLSTHRRCGEACVGELVWYRGETVAARMPFVVEWLVSVDAMITADVDGDGDLEVLVAYRTHLAPQDARVAIADRTLGVWLSTPTAPGCEGVAVDADCDGLVDLIVRCPDAHPPVFLRERDRGFQEWSDPALWAAR
jgi:hypothetical protein